MIMTPAVSYWRFVSAINTLNLLKNKAIVYFSFRVRLGASQFLGCSTHKWSENWTLPPVPVGQVVQIVKIPLLNFWDTSCLLATDNTHTMLGLRTNGEWLDDCLLTIGERKGNLISSCRLWLQGSKRSEEDRGQRGVKKSEREIQRRVKGYKI